MPTPTQAAAKLLIGQLRLPVIVAPMFLVTGPRIVDRVHGYGGLVFSDVASVSHARKAARSGVDALILLCGGAGGHTGWMNPFAFVPAVREFFDGPIILAGSIADGAAIHAAQLLGADATYIGTRFIATHESDAVDEYRQIVLTSEVSGLNANWLRGSLDKLGVKGEKTGRLEGFSADDNFKAWKDIWGAGHGVGAVKRITSLAEVVAELEAGYRLRS